MTVAGIEIRVHATMLLLVWLVVAASADEGDAVAPALAWLGLLFGSVLVHEFAHSLVALQRGVRVSEIELLPIGGVSKMDRIPDRPADELAIAAAGPLTSLAIGTSVLAVSMIAGQASWPPDLYAGPLWPRIGWLNLVLAGFNLVPALPLDGGRVLRALLERHVGPLRSTHLAARAGRYFAVAMIAAGALFNLWLIIIGVFVYIASEGEEAASVVHEQLGRLHAREVMIRQPIVVSPQMTVAEFSRSLQTTAQRQFPVVDQGVYVGMVQADSFGDGASTAGDVCVPAPAVALDTPLDVIAAMDVPAHALAVVVGGHVVGMVEMADVQRLAQLALRRMSAEAPG